MTKNPLSAMSRPVETSSSAVIAKRRVSRYFEEDRLARAVVAEATSPSTRQSGPFTLRVRPGRARSRAIPLVSTVRIVSLVPHATELLFALGLGDDVVAVTHECDFPLEVLELPRVTRDVLPAGLGAAEIDAAVRERTQQGKAIYELDEDRLEELEPDLIVTQELCAVCAVSYDDVVEVAGRLATAPRVVSLDPKTLGEAMGDIRTIAQATGVRDAALELVTRQRARIDAVRRAVQDADSVVRVAAIEWLDPVFVAGHWTPQ